ncbi:MAG: transcription-repair coupling factor [Balneolales bacterium]
MALEQLSKLFSSSLPLKEFHHHIENKKSIRLERFVGSTPSFLIKELEKKYKNILVIYGSFEDAQFLKSDLDALGAQHAKLFPPTGHKPYDNDQMLDSSVLVQRSEVLESIYKAEKKLVITSSEAIFEKIASPESFSKASVVIEIGQLIEPGELMRTLSDQEYSRVSFVDGPGEFASRGGILDVYPFSGEYPIRIEFFGNEIDSLREFDPDSQRSVSFLENARLTPNVNVIGDEERKNLLGYFNDDTVIFLFGIEFILNDLNNRYEEAEASFQRKHADGKQPPEEIFVDAAAFNTSISSKPKIHHGTFQKDMDIDWVCQLDAKAQPDFNSSIKLLRKSIEELSSNDTITYILCDNDGQRDRFEELLGDSSKEMNYHLSVETIHRGFILQDTAVAVYTDHQIFNRYHRPKTKKRKYRGGISFKELKDLNVGDFVVHVDYGIGKFAGFKDIVVLGSSQEAVVVRYQEDSILYVNVSSLHKLQKYSGKEGIAPKITKLGSGEWARKKAKTKKRVKDIARDLIKLYAKRKAQEAFAFSNDTTMQTELEATFKYVETPDQEAAIQDVKQDMMSVHPMDRLVCGDVGFGKTEVAVRAAFKAVMDGKQVAILVPTTILADQHAKTFQERVQNFPVNVDVISRFRSKTDQKEILKKTASGKIDILIGTHRITSKDIKFKDLGLLIVDEEQRFGVGMKEKLKELRASIDVLTLTATPIPRTLQFSLMGARDLSIINTPPPNRQPVYTEIHSFDSQLVRDAIMQEISRGGQIFFIHNRVKNIEEMADMIRQLAPDVRVRFAHGQMTGPQLEKIILDFYAHKFDVLVSTNIVENGIDIANANTIIINRADHFGLAELHQLRGRVGRSDRKAYCYLITPPLEVLTVEARKRLMALEEYSELGSGFNIAMRDLDIRGAGDILGGEQSGFINDIGYDLYNKILNDAVNELKETEFSELFSGIEIESELPETIVEFDLPALLPVNYVSENVERLNLYRKLAMAKSQKDVNDWKDELKDRFGPLPDKAENLIKLTVIKILSSKLYLSKVVVRSERMWLQVPSEKSKAGIDFFEKGRLQSLLENVEHRAPNRYKLIQKNDTIRIAIHGIPDLDAAISLLEELNQPVEVAAVDR